jgi:superfamily II RNA helicase
MELINEARKTNDTTMTKIKQLFPFEFSPFQDKALENILKTNNVLITAHTGSGKTVPAEAAFLYYCKMKGKKVIYTSPVKALTNEKLSSFREKYPDISFGIITGDTTDNPEADVILMTTEILSNQLVKTKNNGEAINKKSILDFEMNYDTELGTVIYDEAHYLFTDRGAAWNNSIVNLPNHIPIICLSATVEKPQVLCDWISEATGNKETILCQNTKRIVPLEHKALLFINNHGNIRNLSKQDKEFLEEMTSNPIPLKTPNEYHGENIIPINKFKKMLAVNRINIQPTYVINQTLKYLKDKDELPCVIYKFSRMGCEKIANCINISLFQKDSKLPHIIEKEAKKLLQEKLVNWKEYTELPEFKTIIQRLGKGYATHHSGVIPVFREMIEKLFNKKYIKCLVATETFAVGINMPIRTTVFTSLEKFDGKGFSYLKTANYTQMAGRAGRRGIDIKGNVYHLNNLFKHKHQDPLNEITYRTIVNGTYLDQNWSYTCSLKSIIQMVARNISIDEFISKSFVKHNNENKYAKNNLDLLINEGYVKVSEQLELTDKGNIALCLGEIPSIAFTDFILKQKDIINKLSSKDLACLFSVFTSIRLSEDSKVINVQELYLNKDTKHLLKKLKRTLDFWKETEVKLYNNVDNYNIHYDLCEIIYKWCDVTEGNQFNVFEELKYWGIFVGDFIKAILKINKLASEVESIAILTENLSLVKKMKEIRTLTLKSIVTNNSLYV